MSKVTSLWGDFEELEDQEVNLDEGQETPDNQEGEEGGEPEESKEEKPEEGEETKPAETSKEGETGEEDSIVSAFDSVVDYLEGEELMFVEADAQYDATPEGFRKLIEDNMLAYKKAMDAEFDKKWNERLSDERKASAPKFADMDISDDSQAHTLVQRYYEELGLTEDEIAEKIVEFKELDSMEREANIAKRFLVKKEAKQEEQAQLEAQREEKAKEARITEYVNSIRTEIDEMDEMAGFKLSNKTKGQFKDYLFKADKEGMTQAQRANQDPKRRLRLAFLDFIDFNKKDFEIKAKTELANEYHKKVSRFTSKQSQLKGKNAEATNESEGFSAGFLDFWNNKE